MGRSPYKPLTRAWDSKKHICLLLLLGVVLSTCRHERETSPPEPCNCGDVNSVEELMDWAYFKEGTVWIYEEETSGARDTFEVLTSNDYISNPSSEPYAFFGYTTHRSSDDYTYWFWFNEEWTAYGCGGGCCDCRRLWCDKYTPGDADGEDVLLTFPTYIGSYAYLWGQGEGGKVAVMNNLVSCQILGETFQNVIIERNDNSVLDQSEQSLDWHTTTYYFAKSVGIVRKEIEETDEVWNLLEYSIVK